MLNFGVPALSGIVIQSVWLARWFTRGRGAALGLALLGPSFGTSLFPVVTTQLASTGHWRGAAAALSVIPAIAVLVVLFLVRERPKDPTEATTGPMPRSPMSLGLSDALRSRFFWMLALVAVAATTAFVSTKVLLFAYLRSRGYSDAFAGGTLSFFFFMSMFGTLAFGILSDRVELRRLLQAAMVALFLGSLCFSSMPPSMTWLAVLLFGLGWGGTFTVLQLLAIDTWGLRAAGAILGSVVACGVGAAALGPLCIGGLHTWSAAWTLSFGALVSLSGVAMLMTFVVTELPSRR